jgi:hypothetical protein
MIAAILIIFAAIFKAIADTLQHHYDTSVFKRMPFQWWNPAESYKYVKFMPLTKYRPDAWHLANTGMINCFIFAAVLNDIEWGWYWQVPAGGVLFILVFNVFYNRILRRK